MFSKTLTRKPKRACRLQGSCNFQQSILHMQEPGDKVACRSSSNLYLEHYHIVLHIPHGCYADSMQLAVPHCKSSFHVYVAVQGWARDLAGQVDHIDVSLLLALLSTMDSLPEASFVRMTQIDLVLPRWLALLSLSCVWLSKTRYIMYHTAAHHTAPGRCHACEPNVAPVQSACNLHR